MDYAWLLDWTIPNYGILRSSGANHSNHSNHSFFTDPANTAIYTDHSNHADRWPPGTSRSGAPNPGTGTNVISAQ